MPETRQQKMQREEPVPIENSTPTASGLGGNPRRIFSSNNLLTAQNDELVAQLQEADAQLDEQAQEIQQLKAQLAAEQQRQQQLATLQNEIREKDRLIQNLRSTAQPEDTDKILRSMQTPQILRDIPCFDGSPGKLNTFTKAIDSIIPMLKKAENSPAWNIWMQAIRSKVVEEADSVLELYGTELSWEEIKQTLTTHFHDKRDEVSLVGDLFNLKQESKTVEEFYGSVTHIVSLLVNQLNINEKKEEVIKAKKSFYQDLGLKKFVSGLKDPLGPIIRAQSPKTLKEALRLCLEERNFEHVKNIAPEKRFQQQPSTSNHPPRPSSSNYPPRQSSFTHLPRPSSSNYPPRLYPFNHPPRQSSFNQSAKQSSFNQPPRQAPFNQPPRPFNKPQPSGNWKQPTQGSTRTKNVEYVKNNPPHYQIEEYPTGYMPFPHPPHCGPEWRKPGQKSLSLKRCVFEP